MSDQDELIDAAREVLLHPLVSGNAVARKLLELLEDDPDQVLSLVLGETSPRGKPTVQAVLERKKAHQRSKKRKPRRRVCRTEPIPQLRLYTLAERPSRPLTVVDVPTEGGQVCPASEFPYHDLGHEELNPIQTAVLPWVDRDVNLVVAAATSAGKTIAAEMMIADGLARGGKGIFLSPLRAVSQEKHDDWTGDHPWSELGVSIVTGDYSLTDKRRRELRRADVVVMTSEMLDSKSRRMSNQNEFLNEVLALVVDEAHLLTMKGRGDALECGVMRFTRKNPSARVILLSATMPNVDELGTWLTCLNGKPSVVIRSDWRPTRLTVHWPTYRVSHGRGSYQRNEASKRKVTLDLVDRYPDDKWLIFVHGKKAGWSLLEELHELHEEAEFHNADLARDKRIELERRFRSGSLRVVVATSTLAYGCYRHGTAVALADGTLRAIEKVGPGDDVLSLVDGRFISSRVRFAAEKQVESALRIRLQTGETCDVSRDHVFYGAVRRDSPAWVEAHELVVGDFLAVPSNLESPRFMIGEQVEDEWAYVLGFVHGDGSICRAGSHADGKSKLQLDVSAGHEDADHLHCFWGILEDVTGERFPEPRRRRDGVWHMVTKRRAVVDAIAAEFGPWDKASLGIPDRASDNTRSLRSYLRGLFDTDGWVQKHGEKNFSVGLSSISETLIRQVQHHLLRFGVRGSVTRHRMRDSVFGERIQPARRDYSWRVTIYNFQAIRFRERIGFRLERKRDRLDEFEFGGTEPNATADLIPVRGLIDDHLLVNQTSPSDLERETGQRRWCVVNRKDITRASAQKIIKAFPDSSALNDLVDQNVLWKKVVEIEDVEGGRFQDITVDGQNFVGAGIVSHNCNLPARRTLILGVHRGISEVDPIDVKQECGRAGRTGMDSEGDAYVLIPENRARQVRQRFSLVPRIESRINDVDVLAFHLTAEVAEGDVRTLADAVAWHSRSLAAHQGNGLEEDGALVSAENVVEKLIQAGILKRDEDGTLSATSLGRVSSWLYYSPFDIADWCSNFRRLVELDKTRDDDCLAWALGKIRTAYKTTYLPKEHERDLNELEWRLRAKGIEQLVPWHDRRARLQGNPVPTETAHLRLREDRPGPQADRPARPPVTRVDLFRFARAPAPLWVRVEGGRLVLDSGRGCQASQAPCPGGNLVGRGRGRSSWICDGRGWETPCDQRRQGRQAGPEGTTAWGVATRLGLS